MGEVGRKKLHPEFMGFDEEYLLGLEEEPPSLVILKGVPEEASKLAELVRSLIDLRELIRSKLSSLDMLSRINDVKYVPPYLALDTGFTSPPLELIGSKLLVIIRSHIIHGTYSEALEPSASVGIVRLVNDEGISKPLSKIIERKFVKEVLELKKEGKLDIDLIMIDGELFPRVPPGFRRSASRGSSVGKLYCKVLELTNEVLKLADETNTALVGILKRVYGRDLIAYLELPEVMVNDKALATYVLSPGEWVDLITYLEIADHLRTFINKYGSKLPTWLLRTLENRLAWLVSVMRESDYLTSNIRVAIYKAKLPTYFMAATKVEVWPSSELPIDDIIAILSSITGVNGVPHPIDQVDSMCRLRREVLHLTQQQLQNELTKLLGDPHLAMALAGLTNPEKMHRVGFR